MENLALRKGLNFVRVEPRITRNDRDQTLDVEFAIVRGERIFVERIDIEGNTTTLDQVIRRQFRTVEGDPFNPREIRQSAERIRALGFFSDAQVDAEPGSGAGSGGGQRRCRGTADRLAEPSARPIRCRDGVGAEHRASRKRTSSGAGRRCRLNDHRPARTTQNSSFSFTEPAFLGRDLRFSFGAFYRDDRQRQRRSTTRATSASSTGIGFPVGEQSPSGPALRPVAETS